MNYGRGSSYDPNAETKGWWKPKPKPRVEPTGEPRDPVCVDIYYGEHATGLGLVFRTRGDLVRHVQAFVSQEVQHGDIIALGGDSKGSFTIRASIGARNAVKCTLFDDIAGVA